MLPRNFASAFLCLKTIWVLLLFVILFSFSTAAHAQSPIIVESQTFENKFPDSMRFHIQASSTAAIQTLRLTVWQRGVALGSRFSPAFTPANQVSAAFSWEFQSFAFGGYLPPGTRGEYTWRIEDAAGNVYDTPRQAYVVEDGSQKWQVLANANVRVSWYAGDGAFGAAVFQRALAAREFFAKELQIENVDPLEIFIYGDPREFFGALPPFSAEWTGGRMFPEYGVIMINFAPDNLEWGLRATSHELSHAILHSKIRGTIGQLSVPHWLDEGLAVYNETDDHASDEQFEQAFQPAARRNTLIPLRSIDQRFPQNSEQAQLAYGQSYSVVKFMIDEFGKEKFAELLNVYQNGALPDEGLNRVFGLNQDELENAWRKKLGVPLREVSTSSLPTIAPRPTYEFSSGISNTPTATRQAAPTLEPTRVSVVATPPPDSSIPAPNMPSSGLCGGLIALSGLVIFGITRKNKR